MSKKLYPLAITICALAAAGCGSNADDIAKAMKASQGSATLIARQAATQVRQMQQKANYLATAYQNQLIFSDRSVRAMDSCSGSFSVDGTACSASCSSDMLTLNASCSFSGQSMSCGGETFTFKDGSLTLTMTISSDYQTFSFSMNMSSNVSGGDLDGLLACKLNLSFNASSGATENSVSCNDFSCSYDGDSIDCEDIQEEFGGSC
jgi:hypothetical protein